MTKSYKIKNLKDYFVELRIRPAMYLGENTITKLHDHLQGYKMAYWFNDIDNLVDKTFFASFNEFVYDYYSVTTSDDWKGVILEQCFGNEQNALDTFFELFDLYIGNAKTTKTKEIVLELFDKLVTRQDDLKSKLGENFSTVFNDTIELIKDNALSNLKYDYDGIFKQLKEKGEDIPELKSILEELEKQYTN
jgi:hypothetical protein